SMRIVLQLTGAPRYSVFALYSPFRLVIDLERPPDPDAPIASTPTRAAATLVADVTTHETTTPVTPPAATAPSTSPSPPPAAAGAPPSPSPSATPPTALVIPPGTPDVPLKSTRTTPVALPAPPASTAHGDYSLSRQLGLGLSRIVIDPGHGGHDPGAQGNGIDE